MIDKEREGFGTIRKEFGYRELIMRQLDRINQIAIMVFNPSPTKANMRPYIQAVGTLEAMLHPYFDREYIGARAEIDKRAKIGTKKIGTKHSVNILYTTENYQKIFALYQDVLTLLMDLMSRKGLLLEEFGAEPYDRPELDE